MKPYIHAQSSVKRFGGEVKDYLKIHDWFDQTKSHFGDNRHRAILHSSFGIFLCESVFGHVIVNADGKEVSVRDIGEQHVIEDLRCIPTISDYLTEMEYQEWMHGKGEYPPSHRGSEKFDEVPATKPKKPKNPLDTPFPEIPFPDIIGPQIHDDVGGPISPTRYD